MTYESSVGGRYLCGDVTAPLCAHALIFDKRGARAMPALFILCYDLLIDVYSCFKRQKFLTVHRRDLNSSCLYNYTCYCKLLDWNDTLDSQLKTLYNVISMLLQFFINRDRSP